MDRPLSLQLGAGMRAVQTMALLLLAALMVLATATGLQAAVSDGMTWSLTAIGFALLAAPLFAVAALTLRREPRNLLVAVVAFACLFAVPFVMTLDLPYPSSWLPLLVLDAGLAALLVASIVANRRGRRRLLVLTTVALAAALLVALGATMLMAATPLFGGTVQHNGPQSPDGHWSLVGTESDMGITDPGYAGVVVTRSPGGMLREQRRLWSGNGWGPSMRWRDSRTVVLDGRQVDIFRGTPIETAE